MRGAGHEAASKDHMAQPTPQRDPHPLGLCARLSRHDHSPARIGLWLSATEVDVAHGIPPRLLDRFRLSRKR